MVSPVKNAASTVITIQKSRCPVVKALNSAGSAISSVANDVYRGWNSTVDYLCPRNPLTHRRQFLALPLKWEFSLGEFAEYQESARVIRNTDEFTPLEHSTVKVFEALKGVLPNYKNTKWPATLRFCDKSVNNAYCAPGCKVTVYTGIEKTIQGHLKSMKEIEFVDAKGKKVKMDVSDVKYEDVMAALLGHELTHGVARHSGARITFGLFLTSILMVSSFALKFIAKTFFSAPVSIFDAHNHKRDEKNTFRSNLSQRKFTPIGSLLNSLATLTEFDSIRDLIRNLVTLSYSRTNEYEADRLGMKLAHEAGYNAKGALVLTEILRRESFDPKNPLLRGFLNLISSHPLSSDRIKANYKAYLEIQAKESTKV